MDAPLGAHIRRCRGLRSTLFRRGVLKAAFTFSNGCLSLGFKTAGVLRERLAWQYFNCTEGSLVRPGFVGFRFKRGDFRLLAPAVTIPAPRTSSIIGFLRWTWRGGHGSCGLWTWRSGHGPCGLNGFRRERRNFCRRGYFAWRLHSNWSGNPSGWAGTAFLQLHKLVFN